MDRVLAGISFHIRRRSRRTSIRLRLPPWLDLYWKLSDRFWHDDDKPSLKLLGNHTSPRPRRRTRERMSLCP